MDWAFGIIVIAALIVISDAQQEIKKGEKCDSTADVGFVVDSSTSLIQSYGKEKDFIKKLAKKLNISEDGTHTSVVLFSEFANLTIPFGAANTLESFCREVDNMPFMDSTTRIDRALKVAYSQMFTEKNGMRKTSKKVLILLTDGEQTKDEDAIPPGEAIKPFYRLGASVIVIGIGSRVNKAEDELRSMIQGKGVLLFAANFDELRLDSFLNSIVDSARINCFTEVINCGSFTDIGFLIDSSGSLRSDYGKEKEFVKLLADSFGLSKSGPRGGLISFSDVANVNVRFSDFTTLERFKNTVENLPLLGTITRIDLALEAARSELFANNNGKNDPNEKLLFLLTDGSQIPEPGYTEPSIIAKAIRKSGIRLVIIGIGDGISMYELNRIAGSESKIYLAKSFNDLLSTDFVRRIKNDFCENNETITKSEVCEMSDIGFLLDSSQTPQNDFQRRKEFMHLLAERFNFSSSGNHPGLISFGETSRTVTKFSEKLNSQELKFVVSRLSILGQTIRIDKALMKANEELYKFSNGMRMNSHKLLIVITGSEESQDTDTLSLSKAVKPLHDAGVRVIVIGIGFQVREDKLKNLVKRSSDLILPDNLNEISLDVFVDSVVETACKETGQVTECSSVADLSFVLDSSTSMKENYDSEKFVVKEIASSFKISPMDTRVSLVIFSDTAELVFGFNDYSDQTKFRYAVDQLKLMDSVTRIDLALELANSKVFGPGSGTRAGLPKILILLTDGSQTKDYPHKDPAKIAAAMRSKGIQILVIGVGDFIKKDELVKLAGDEKNVYLAKTKSELKSSTFVKRIIQTSCTYASPRRRNYRSFR